jgi:hypothetical protein
MDSIKLRTHIGEDGMLQVKLPDLVANRDIEVMVIYQPVNEEAKRKWPPGFIERIAGSWQGEPLIREPQGEYPERESLE